MMKDFQTLVLEWIDAQIQLYLKFIEQRKKQYLDKKWAWSEDAVRDFNERLDTLRAMRTSVVKELAFGKAHGESLLVLANIVYNEAGTSNQEAKVAVAYA